MDAFLTGGGESGALLRSVDWSRTSLGPVEGWSASLKTIAGVVLHSRHPMFLWWGPELVQIYNDAYVPSFGSGKHPTAMGQRGKDCWGEIWSIIGPQIDDVMQRGTPSWQADALVPIIRNGRVEDVYWTYGYSPVYQEDGAVGGTLVVCTETTARVLGERRQRAARRLAEHTMLATEAGAVVPRAMEVLAELPEDVTCAMAYRWDPAACRAELLGACGRDAAARGDLADEVRARVDALLARPGGGAGEFELVGSETNPRAAIVAIDAASGQGAGRVMVFGLNERLPFDGSYRELLRQLTVHVSLVEERIVAFRARAAIEAERDSLLVKAPVATALWSGPEHVFELANPLYCQVVGRRAEALIGVRLLDAVPEIRATTLPGIFDSVYATGEPFVASEMLIALDRRGEGSLEDRYFKFNLEPMRDAAGRVSGIMAVALDITDQVSARRTLEKGQTEREALLAELERAGLAKDEFLAMLGHELRNPLSPIVTAVRLMRSRGETSRSDRELRIIERQVAHLVRLVDDLLDVSKITRGKVRLQCETVEIHDVLAKAVEIAADLFESRAQHLSIDVPPRGLAWFGDPVRLAQSVANLLTNAARYTPPGGRILLKAAREAGDMVITVRDDGQGIAPELLPRVFDLFTQGHRAADRAEGGLGLGLALVKNLVILHGGTVSAASEGPGMGSEFVIRLPAPAGGDAAPSTAQQRSATLAPAIVGRRVLLVDDNADAADMLGEMLREVGHEVRVVHDPIVALATLEGFSPEVAILDIGLPVMDGYELAARMRAAGARCRLIALTGYGQDHDRARSRDAGFELHLVKPVDADYVIAVVDAPPPDARGERAR